MTDYLLQGIALGFAAGISPGPMLVLVISQTLHRGWRAGNLVALAPLLTDAPIILLFLFILHNLPLAVLHWLSILGGMFLIYLGVETARATRSSVAIKAQEMPGRVVLLAVMTNLFSPQPYLFWATVGITLLAQSFTVGGVPATIAFLVGFYCLLVGTKVVIAFLVSRSRNWLTGRGYQWLLIGCSLLLAGLGVLLIWQGLQAVL